MDIRFEDTTLDRGKNHLRLLDPRGAVIIELKGLAIDDAIRCGYLQPESLHYSLFEYARLKSELAPLVRDERTRPPETSDRDVVKRLLGDLGMESA